jgi:hypothetical protein
MCCTPQNYNCWFQTSFPTVNHSWTWPQILHSKCECCCQHTHFTRRIPRLPLIVVNYVWNVMAHAPKPDFVLRRNGRVHLNRRGRQFSRLLAAEVCASAVVMLDAPCSEVVWRVLATHSIRQFPLHFPSRASPCAITFQLDSTSHLLQSRPRTLLRSDYLRLLQYHFQFMNHPASPRHTYSIVI